MFKLNESVATVLLAQIPSALPCEQLVKEILGDASNASVPRVCEKVAARILAIACIRESLGSGEALVKLAVHSSGQPYAVCDGQAYPVSWAHTNGYVVAATCAGRIGVDLELVERELNQARLNRLVSACLHPLEQSVALHKDSFLKRWVLKEAIVKGDGGGISLGLNKITLDVEAQPPNFVHSDTAALDPSAWTLAYERATCGGKQLHIGLALPAGCAHVLRFFNLEWASPNNRELSAH